MPLNDPARPQGENYSSGKYTHLVMGNGTKLSKIIKKCLQSLRDYLHFGFRKRDIVDVVAKADTATNSKEFRDEIDSFTLRCK